MELTVMNEPTAVAPLVGRSRAELEAFVAELGQPKYRARQLAQWLR